MTIGWPKTVTVLLRCDSCGFKVPQLIREEASDIV
jgi:hypothetical protein